jgi:hypothetical protein
MQDAELVDTPPRRGLSLGPIIAIVCVLLLISFAIFLLLWNPGVKQIALVNPLDIDSNDDGCFDSMRMEFVAIKDGARKLDETALILIENSGETVYTAKVSVKEEQFYIDVRYDSFVTGNGIYRISASVGSVKADTEYAASFVAQNLTASLQEYTDKETGEYIMNVVATPVFSGIVAGKGFRMDEYEKGYKLTCSIAEPDGSVSEYTYTMDELPGEYSETFALPGSMMGDYTATVTLENVMVKADSPYKFVQADRTISEFINRPPVIDELRAPSKIRVNQEMELTCKATDQDSNGGLVSFYITWGEVDDEGYEDIQEKNVTGNPSTIKVKHIYSKTGDYNITVTAVDNGPRADQNDPDDRGEARMALKYIWISVRLV